MVITAKIDNNFIFLWLQAEEHELIMNN